MLSLHSAIVDKPVPLIILSQDILKAIPLKVILDEEFGLFSAACRAKMLLKTK